MDTILTIISLTYEDNMKKSFFLFLLLLLTRLLFTETLSIQDVLDELNFVGTNPKGYIEILREHINTFDDMYTQMKEVLKNTEPMQTIGMNENLCNVVLWGAEANITQMEEGIQVLMVLF